MSEEIKVNKRKIMVNHSDEPVESLPAEEKPSATPSNLKPKVIQPLGDSAASGPEDNGIQIPVQTTAGNSEPATAPSPVQAAPRVTLGNLGDSSPVETPKSEPKTTEAIASSEDDKTDQDTASPAQAVAPSSVAPPIPAASIEDLATNKAPSPDTEATAAEEPPEASPVAADMPDSETQPLPPLADDQGLPASPAPATDHAKVKKIINTKQYKVQVGRKGKKSKQAAQRKNSSKKGWKVFAILLAILLLLGAIWAYAFYLLPQQAIPGYLKRLSKTGSYSYELDAALTTSGSRGAKESTFHVSGKVDQSAGSTSSETEIGEGADKTTYYYADGQHSKTAGQETTNVKSDEAADVFGNKCGANEVIILQRIVVAAAKGYELDGAIEADPLLVSRENSRLGLSYYGAVEPAQGAELFDDITAEFVTTCGSDLMPEHHSDLAELFRGASIQVELNRGWASDYLKLTAERGDTRLVLDLVTYDYNDTEVSTVLAVTKEPEEPAEEVCEAACRDQERQADLDKLNKLLVSYYGSEPDGRGYYPLPADFVAANFADADPEIFEDPADKTINNGGELGYIYRVLPTGCDNLSVKCSEYSLVTKLEVTAEKYQYPKVESEEER